MLQRTYRELVRRHLGRLLDNLFTDFTGVHFHIAWAPISSEQWKAKVLPTACSACCRLSGSPLLPDCKSCGQKQLARALSTDGDGHRFTCRLGVRNYWIPIRVRDETLGIAYLQALDHPVARHSVRTPTARTKRTRLRRAEAVAMSRVRFARAGRFLQHIVQHVQTSSLSDLRKADLTTAGRAVVALEKEQARLHDALKRHLPPAVEARRRSRPASHPEQVVQRLLALIELDYGKPITLKNCARELGMNATYLSDLFSHAVGVPFKTYLTELRLEKAQGAACRY